MPKHTRKTVNQANEEQHKLGPTVNSEAAKPIRNVEDM